MPKKDFRWAQAIVFFLGALATASPGLFAATVYHNSASGYSLTLPDGWAPLGPAKMKAIAAAFTSNHPSVPTTVDAAYAPNGRIGPDGQFLLIATLGASSGNQLNSRGMDDFMRGLTGGALKAKVPGATIASSALDKSARTYTAHMIIPANGIKIHASLFGFFGRKNVVQICAYSSEAQFPKAYVQYHQVAQTFNYDPGFAYDNTEYKIQLAVTSIMGAAVLIAIAVGIVLVVRASRRKPAAIPLAGYYGLPQQQAGSAGWPYPGAASPPPSIPPPLPGNWPPR